MVDHVRSRVVSEAIRPDKVEVVYNSAKDDLSGDRVFHFHGEEVKTAQRDVAKPGDSVHGLVASSRKLSSGRLVVAKEDDVVTDETWRPASHVHLVFADRLALLGNLC